MKGPPGQTGKYGQYGGRRRAGQAADHSDARQPTLARLLAQPERPAPGPVQPAVVRPRVVALERRVGASPSTGRCLAWYTEPWRRGRLATRRRLSEGWM